MKRVGKYELVEKLREDELGQVFIGSESEDADPVEVRILPEGLLKGRSRKRLLDGVKRLAQLGEASVSGWIDGFEERGRLALVHERLEGETLRERLSNDGALPWREAAKISSLVAGALSAVHSTDPPLVHGDLRPETIVLRGGQVQLRDFLLAELVDELSEKGTLAVSRLRYVSPEQLEGLEASPSSDLYALGLILFEMITGEEVFKETSIKALEAQKQSLEVEVSNKMRRELPERLIPLIESMSAVDADDRPLRAGDVREALETLLARTKAPSPGSSDLLGSYVERVMALSSERTNALDPDELKDIALELGMSEEDLAAADEAAEGHMVRGQGYLEHELWDDAIEQLTNAMALAPLKVEMVFSLAKGYAGRWRAKAVKADCLEAQRLARHCVDLDPRHKEGFELLSELDKELEKHVEEPKGKLNLATPKSRRTSRASRGRKRYSFPQLGVIALISALVSMVGLISFDPLGVREPEVVPATPAAPQTTPDTPTPDTPPVPKPEPTPEPPKPTVDTPPHPTPTANRIKGHGGLTFLKISAGKALLGSEPGIGDADEHPQRSLSLADYYIGETEVSVEAYRKCVEAGACPDAYFTSYSNATTACHFGQPGADGLPMNCISAYGAENFCAWMGRSDASLSYRLPTEAEWEKAARGVSGQRYAWGEKVNTLCLTNEGGCSASEAAEPVGSRVTDASPYGVLELGGNVSEWTLAVYENIESEARLLPGAPHAFTVRGGNFKGKGVMVRAADREPIPVPLGTSGNNAPDVGFRCVAK